MNRALKKESRTCSKGHQYYKSSDCPTCPVCEDERKPRDTFISLFVTTARRALENKGIRTLKELSMYKEAEILELHGIGKSSINKLKRELELIGLKFRTE